MEEQGPPPTYLLLLAATTTATILALIADRLLYLITLIIFGRPYPESFLRMSNVRFPDLPNNLFFIVLTILYIWFIIFLVQQVIVLISGCLYGLLDLAFYWAVSFFVTFTITLIITAALDFLIHFTTASQILLALFLALPVWTWSLEGQTVQALFGRAARGQVFRPKD